MLSATSTITILPNGNVGVGTTSPSTKFAVNGVGYFTNLILGTALSIANGGTGTSTVPTLGQILMGNSSGGYNLVATSTLGLQSALTGTQGQVLYFSGANTPAATSSLFIAANGNIGIGSTTPSALFTVDSSSTTGTIFRLNNTSTGGRVYSILSTGSANTSGAGRFDIFDNASSTSRLSIAANGNVGIGTTTPGTQFTVAGNSYFTGSLNVGDPITTRSNLGLTYASNQDAGTSMPTVNISGNSYSLMAWGDSLTSQNGSGGTNGAIPYPTQLGNLAGFSVYLGGIGGQGSGQIASRMLAATSTYALPTIIWAGRNDYNSPSTVLSNIASMVAALQSVGNSNYLVLSVINGDFGSTEYAGGAGYNQIASINSSLASTYGSHYVDVRSYLVSHYNSASPIDVIDHANDVPPSSLRSVLKAGTLSGSLNASATSFTLTYTTGTLAVGDIISIDGEKILVGSGSSGSSVTNATRGYFGTTAASHTSGVSFNVYDQLHLSTAGYAAVVTSILQNEDALLGTSNINSSVVTPQLLRKALTNFSSGYFLNYLPFINASSTTFSTVLGLGAANGLLASATYDTAVGYNALFTATTSSFTSAFGANALYYNTTGNSNSAFGAQASQANTTGSANNAFGRQALYANTTGASNNGFGNGALGAVTTASYNSAFGDLAANLTTGQRNVAFGAAALVSNTSGSFNAAVGANALYFNAANSVTAIGYQAGVGTGGYANQGSVYVGFQSGDKAGNNSDYNTFVGYQSGYGVTTGARNIVIGPSTITASFNQITTGSNNISIGNDIAVASSTASNQLNIGNVLFGTGLTGTGTTTAGKIGIGTSSPTTLFEVGGATNNVTFDGYLNCTGFTSTGAGLLTCTASDERLKQNIESLSATSTLDALAQLNPVSFHWKSETGRGDTLQYGLLAQQVQGIFPNLVTKTNPTALTPDGTFTVNYEGMIAPLIVGVQELIKDFKDLKASFENHFPNANTLCVGQTCLTEDQLKTLLQNSGQQSVQVIQLPPSDPTPASGNATTTPVEEEVSTDPAPVEPEEAPVPETPAPADPAE